MRIGVMPPNRTLISKTFALPCALRRNWKFAGPSGPSASARLDVELGKRQRAA
jgi:hypothetical protein